MLSDFHSLSLSCELGCQVEDLSQQPLLVHMLRLTLLLTVLADAAWAYRLPASAAMPIGSPVRAATPRLQAPFDLGKEETAAMPEAEDLSAPARDPAAAADRVVYAPFSDVELAEQDAKLTALAEKWEKREALLEYEETIRSGFGPAPETINGRFAMFFFVTGLITEYYTGQSLPQQLYTMLQTLSIVEVRTRPRQHPALRARRSLP